MFWILIELLILIVMAAFFATQLIIPLWRDRPLFPAFRRGMADELADDVSRRLEDERRLHEVLERKRELDELSSENLKARLSVDEPTSLGSDDRGMGLGETAVPEPELTKR